MGADYSVTAEELCSGESRQDSSQQDSTRRAPSQRAPFPEGDPFAEHLASARDGNGAKLGEIFETFRDYLLLIANCEEPGDLRPKVAPSDLVQETFVEARRDLDGFRGTTTEQFRGWLRTILLHNVADVTKQYCDTAMRQLCLEIPLTQLCEQEISLDRAAAEGSPGSQVVASDELERLETALGKLTPELRRVVELRNLQGCTFVEIGQRLDLSRYAVSKLWSCALVELGAILEKVP